MSMSVYGIVLGTVMVGAGIACAAGPATAPDAEAAKMLELLRPWLDPAFEKTEGTDNNVKEFVAKTLPQIQAAAPEKLSAVPAKKRKVLVLTTDTLGALHAPGAAGLVVLLRETARRHESLEFVEVFSARGLDAETLRQFDAVVLNNISQHFGGAYNDFYNKTLPQYVKDGGGVVGVHGSALLFRMQPDAEYNKMLGGFTTHPSVHPKRHGIEFPIKLPEPDHPLAAGFRMKPRAYSTMGQWLDGRQRKLAKVEYEAPALLSDELYTFNPLSNADGASRVIASIDMKKAGEKGPGFPEGTNEFGYALSWHKDYGKGRVFYTQFGHNYCVFSFHCIAQSIVDGLLYATGDMKVEARQ